MTPSCAVTSLVTAFHTTSAASRDDAGQLELAERSVGGTRERGRTLDGRLYLLHEAAEDGPALALGQWLNPRESGSVCRRKRGEADECCDEGEDRERKLGDDEAVLRRGGARRRRRRGETHLAWLGAVSWNWREDEG